MAAADPVLERLQSIQSLMESFGESLSQLCKDSSSESALDLQKNLMEYYNDLHKGLQSRYESLKIKEKKPEESGSRDKNKENETTKVIGLSPAISSFTKVPSNVDVRPEIKTLCDKADGAGLRNYIMDNLKEVEALRNELSVALSKVPNAAELVLNALEGYDFSESGSVLGEKKKPPYSPNRKACILLLESLFPIFGSDDSGFVPSEVKDLARGIAKVWRKEMKIENLDSASGLDVQALLQLLASFRIAADYEKDELWSLVYAILGRKQAPELCWSLGLSHYIPDLIDKLSETGQQLEALKFAHAFGMLDKVDPVDLLKSYLRDAEKAAKELLMKGRGSAESENYSHTKMVSAMNTVIGFVKKYDLQVHFFEDNLQKKLRKLEQDKKDRKKNKKKAANRYAEERISRKKDFKPRAEHIADRKKAVAEKKARLKEERMKAAEEKEKHKRRQSFEPGYGLSESENYSLKRAKCALSNERTRVAGGMGNLKALPYNIDGVQNKSGIIGHDHHTSALSAANMSSMGPAAGSFTSAPSIATQINDVRRRHEGYPSTFGISNLTPIESSLYGSGAPSGAFAAPLSNVAEVNYEGRAQQKYAFNFGGVGKNDVRASVYGTGDLAKSSAYKLNFGEIDNNPVRTSVYGTGTSVFGHGNTGTSDFGGGSMASVGSSVYGSNSRTIHSSDVNQVSHERSLGQYSGFAGRNMVPVESSGYGSGVSTIPPSSVTQGNSERRESVIDRHLFNSGLNSLPPTY